MSNRKACTREPADRSDELPKWSIAPIVARPMIIKERLINVCLDDQLIEVTARPGIPGQERVREASKATPPARSESLKALLAQDFI